MNKLQFWIVLTVKDETISVSGKTFVHLIYDLISHLFCHDREETEIHCLHMLVCIYHIPLLKFLISFFCLRVCFICRDLVPLVWVISKRKS